MNVLDIETIKNNDNVVPYCICANINEKLIISYYTENNDIVIDFLNKLILIVYKTIDIYSHNINFDGMIILNCLMKNNIQFTWFVRELNIYWIEFIYVNIKIRIRCSLKIIPLSAKQIGNMSNIQKTYFPYKFGNIKNLEYIGKIPSAKYFESPDEYNEFIKIHKYFDFKLHSIEYCKKDIQIIKNVLEKIHDIVKNYYKKSFSSSFSFSSLSYKIYSKKFDTFGITKINITNKEHNYISQSYYGGRCEVFGNPDNKIIHHFDFSGMYGQCMMQKFPVGIGKFKDTNLDYKKIGLHVVEVESKMDIPILPVHYNKKLLFPNGKFVGCYTWEELELFTNNNGKILKHYQSYEYDNSEYVFKDFVEEFTKIREKGIYYKVFGKSMINGLYGSFALRDDDTITIITYSEEELESIKKVVDVLNWKKQGKCIIIRIAKNYKAKKYYDQQDKWDFEYKNRNLIYASIIASKARIKLYNAFKSVINSGGELYYCDTDSIFAGYSTNQLKKQFGEVIWTDIYDDAIFISPKFYYVNDENQNMKIKGVKNQKYDYNQLKQKFYSNQNIIEFEDQLSFVKKDWELKQFYNTKKIKLNIYNKRIFSMDKRKTIPIEIPRLIE